MGQQDLPRRAVVRGGVAAAMLRAGVALVLLLAAGCRREETATVQQVPPAAGPAAPSPADEPGPGAASGPASPAPEDPAPQDPADPGPPLDVGPASIAAARLAAEADFPKFIDAAWPQRAPYGFLADDARESVALAEPFCVFGLDAEAVARLHAGETVASAVRPAGEWIFPVAAAGAWRTLFGVRPAADGWRGVYLGNPQLAAALAGLRQAWGDDVLLLSSTDPRGFFFSVPGRGPTNLTPLTGVKVVDGGFLEAPADWRELQDLAAILPLLQAHTLNPDPEDPSLPGGLDQGGK